MFFSQASNWILNNIIIINPGIKIFNTDAYYTVKSLETISNIIKTFETGISEIKTKIISVDEKMIHRRLKN